MAGASVKQRKEGVWRARYRDASGREHAKHFARKSDATRWLAEQVTAVTKGTWIDPGAGRVTFSDYYTEWSARQVWQPTTRRAMDLAAGSVPFAGRQLSSLLPSEVEAWVKQMHTDGLAASTIRTRVNNVRSVLRSAVRDRLIAHDPSEGVTLPRDRRRDVSMTIPTPEAVRAVLGASKAPWKVFFALCAFAGLREGEACGLQVTDVDFLRRQLHVRRQVQRLDGGKVDVRAPKYESERTVSLPDGLLAMLAEHVRTLDGEWLFTSDRGPAHANTVGYQWRAACAKAGVTAKLHDLRHFYASALIAAGCDVVTVQRALGHSKATTTLNTYSHLWPTAEDRTRDAASSFMARTLDSADDSRTTAQR